jgi:hypothetical protein
MNEQIEKQAIEEMANDLMICHVEFGEDDDIRTDYDATATMLYRDKGYRKQSEGVWIYNPDGIDWGLGAWQCSLCSCNNHNLPQDKDTNPLIWAGAKYCPNCGAKMKGGAE